MPVKIHGNDYTTCDERLKMFHEKYKDKVKSILPFEYWFGLNASKVAGTTERKRARDMLNDYRDGKLPASLIYVDPNAKNRRSW